VSLAPRLEDDADATRPGWRWRFAALRAAVTALVLAVLLAILPTDQLVEGLSRISVGRWLAVLLGLSAGHAVAAAKWGWLLRAGGVSCDRLETLRAHGAGLFANVCLPSIVGGDLVRAGMLVRAGGHVAPVAVASLADRLVDTGALLTLAALGAIWALGGAQASLPGGATALMLAAALGIIFAPLTGRAVLRQIENAPLPAGLCRLAGKLREAVDCLLRLPHVAGACFATSLAIQCGFVLLNAALGRAIGIDVPLGVWFLAWPLAKLAGLAPVSLGGLGVRESVLAGLLAPFGVAPAMAVAQGLLWQSVVIAVGLMAGIAAYGSRRVARSQKGAVTGGES
jgi:uncharacterized membrane protein YbhN (UPF0104 family)